MRKFYFTFILLFPICLIAQTDWEDIEPVEFLKELRVFEELIPEGESYSFYTSYLVYNDFADVIPIQTHSGYLVSKNGVDFNISQMGYLIIQNEKYNVSIDSINRQLVVQFSDPAFSYRKTLEDYTELVEVTEEIKKRVANNTTYYSLILKPGYSFHSMEYAFTKDNLISEVIIYGNRPYSSEDKNNGNSMNRSKVIIRFTDFKIGKSVSFKEFVSLEELIHFDNDRIEPLGKYEKYEILDLRE